jgi:HEAT repeat protein
MPALAPGFDFQGQGRGISREEIARIAEEARANARAQSDMMREQTRVTQELAREQARDIAQHSREIALEQSRMMADRARITSQGGFGYSYSLGEPRPPAAWAQRDPADSLWRAANEVMNKGDYRKAASIFKEIPQKFQYSAYAADAMYWTAHALYRVGSTPDLQDALQTLEQLKQKYPNSRIRGSQADVAALQVRIAGVLSSRGQGGSDIVKRALAQQADVCDQEEQQIRSAALNALMQTDADAATDYAMKLLARKDNCSREMRRSAVFLIGNKGDPKAVPTLIAVAKDDPSIDVRATAVQYLGRMPGDQALGALEELARTDSETQVQRSAIQQLARRAEPRARNGIKAMVERNDVSENMRIAALDALDPDHATQDDVAWLQATYTKVDSPRIRSRIINAMARIGGSQNEKWFTTLANNENESIDVRVEALRRAGQSMDIGALGRLYDQTGQRSLRSELVRQLGNRREPEAVDKLGDIAKNGTDPSIRTRAIEVLTSKAKNDERAQKVLLQLLDRP